jgi:hypothetical protein
VLTEDGLYYYIDCVYPIKELDKSYLGKMDSIAS